jgi:hypothetical protein
MSRNYSNFAKTASLAAPVAAADTSIDVDTQTDYPAPSYVIVVYEGAGTPQAAPKKEVMKASGVTDNGDGTFTLDVDRDIDGYNGGGISFSDSATVEHTVVADEVGPKSSFLKAKGLKADRYPLYDDFCRSDRSLGGDSLPTGQTWQEDLGTNVIQDNLYRNTNTNESRILAPYDPETTVGETYQIEAVLYRTTEKNKRPALYTHWVDSNNWIRLRKGNGSLQLQVSESGTVSQLSELGGAINRSGLLRIGMIYVPHNNHFNFYMLPIESGGNYYGASSSINSLVADSTHVGLEISGYDESYWESICVYKPTDYS